LTDTTTPASATWSNHEGYDLTRHVMTAEQLNDRDRHHNNLITGSVRATKFTGQEFAFVLVDLASGPAGMSVRMSPENARTLAKALLTAADIVDAFEADEAMAQEAELARFNAGPIHPIPVGQRVVEVAKGYFAFEPATCNMVNEGGAA